MNRHDEEFFIQKIRARYTELKPDKLIELKKLDAKVRRPANIFGYVYGSISAIILGSGMSFVMTDIAAQVGLSGDPMIFGIVIGVIGLGMALLTYPIYKRILKSRKRKYAKQILEMSEQMLQD